MTTAGNMQDIVKCFICDICSDYLYHPIKMVTETNQVICGFCTKEYKEDELGDILQLSNIGKLLQLPCPNHKFGCRELCAWKEETHHTFSCPFRLYKCPFVNCEWIGNISDLLCHYKNKHTMWDNDKLVNFEENSKKQFLIETHGELFVFQTMCVSEELTYYNDHFQTMYIAKESALYYNIYFLGSQQRASHYYYIIKLYRVKKRDQQDNEYNPVYITQKEVSSDLHAAAFPNCTEKTSVNINMLKAMLKDTSSIYLSLTINIRKPLYNGKVDEALIREIECPVCKDHMMRPIRMCLAGHNICDFCYQKLTQCPICAGKFGPTRNISLETLSDNMHYRCMYFEQGCTFTDVPQNIKTHEEHCEISFYDCPLKQLFGCKWRGKIENICDHAESEHNFKF